MNAHNLNQSGKKIPDKPYVRGDKVYFYLTESALISDIYIIPDEYDI